MNAADFKINFQHVNDQLTQCRKKLKELEERQKSSGNASDTSIVCTSTSIYASEASTSLVNANLNFILDKTIDVSTETGCRVLHFSERLSALLVSAQGNNAVFAGYGVKKVIYLIFSKNFSNKIKIKNFTKKFLIFFRLKFYFFFNVVVHSC